MRVKLRKSIPIPLLTKVSSVAAFRESRDPVPNWNRVAGALQLVPKAGLVPNAEVRRPFRFHVSYRAPRPNASNRARRIRRQSASP